MERTLKAETAELFYLDNLEFLCLNAQTYSFQKFLERPAHSCHNIVLIWHQL